VEEDQPQRLADLDGADAAAEAVPLAEIGERIFEVLHHPAGLVQVRGRGGNAAQRVVAEFENASHGHASMLCQRRRRRHSGKLG